MENKTPGNRIRLKDRYSRQALFPPVGEAGQQRLGQSAAVVIGCGGLGSVICEMLARAGVGRLLVVDRDLVEWSNLQRQILFDEQDAREELPKAEAAGRKLRAINSGIRIETRVADVNPSNIEEIIAGADVVMDGLDNFETRFLINDACLKHRIPWIYGACVASHGVVLPVIPGRPPCLRCVFEAAPAPGSAPTCDTAGVLAPIVNVVASMQVAEALKILTGNLQAVSTGLRQIDIWFNRFMEVDAARLANHESCPACTGQRYDYLDSLPDSESSMAVSLCGRGAMQVTPRKPREGFSLAALEERLRSVGKASSNRFMLKFESPEIRFTAFPDGRAVFQDVEDPARARTLYARYIGS